MTKLFALLLVPLMTLCQITFTTDMRWPTASIGIEIIRVETTPYTFKFNIGSDALTAGANANVVDQTIYYYQAGAKEDGTQIWAAAETMPCANVVISVSLSMTPVSGIPRTYTPRLDAFVPYNAIKYFAATLDYGDGTSIWVAKTNGSTVPTQLQLTYPNKYYGVGTYSVTIPSYSMTVNNMDDPTKTESATISYNMYTISN